LIAAIFVLSSFLLTSPAGLWADENKEEGGTQINVQNGNNGTDQDDYPSYKDYEEAKYGRVKLGLKGGLNVSTLYNAGSQVTDDRARIGYNFGGYAEAPLTKFLSIKPEILFSLKGNSSNFQLNTGSTAAGNGAMQTNLYYIEMPIMAGLHLTDNISVEAGPYAAYLLGADVKNTSSNTAYNQYESLNRNDFNTIDYGIAAGMNFDIANMWDVGFRYNHGLRNISKTGATSADLMQNARNADFQVYMGVYFK
jgi:hypothetical protein